jgi:integrase
VRNTHAALHRALRDAVRWGYAGLPRIRLHDIETQLRQRRLAAGVPAKVVSERPGHANFGITMDTYIHVMPHLDQEAANKVADLIFGNDEEGSSEGS